MSFQVQSERTKVEASEAGITQFEWCKQGIPEEGMQFSPPSPEKYLKKCSSTKDRLYPTQCLLPSAPIPFTQSEHQLLNTGTALPLLDLPQFAHF